MIRSQFLMISKQKFCRLLVRFQDHELNVIDDEEMFSFSDHQFDGNLAYPEEIHEFPEPIEEVSPEWPILIDERENSSQGEAMNFEAETVGQLKRANNTIFKTSLSEYRKSIIDQIKKDSALKWIRPLIQQFYGVKNLSVFPKLNIMVRQLNISHKIETRWLQRCDQLLEKKWKLINQGKYSVSRLDELRKSIEAMNQCMSEPLFEVGFQKYWGKFKQLSKFDKSKEVVLNYLEQFKILVKENSAHGKFSEPLRKRAVNSEQPSKRRKATTDDSAN